MRRRKKTTVTSQLKKAARKKWADEFKACWRKYKKRILLGLSAYVVLWAVGLFIPIPEFAVVLIASILMGVTMILPLMLLLWVFDPMGSIWAWDSERISRRNWFFFHVINFSLWMSGSFIFVHHEYVIKFTMIGVILSMLAAMVALFKWQSWASEWNPDWRKKAREYIWTRRRNQKLADEEEVAEAEATLERHGKR